MEERTDTDAIVYTDEASGSIGRAHPAQVLTETYARSRLQPRISLNLHIYKESRKVLGFVKFGGPKLTVGSAMFELDFGLNAGGSRSL